MPYSVNRALSLLCIGPFLVAMLGVMIVAGLIATPAKCACGAGMPHPHSVFMLPGHHHTSDGHHVTLPAPTHDQAHHHALNAPGDEVPRMQEMAGHASDPLAMLAGEASDEHYAWQRWTSIYARSVLHEGQVLQPETGPPQYPG